jgi:hypothetical protein
MTDFEAFLYRGRYVISHEFDVEGIWLRWEDVVSAREPAQSVFDRLVELDESDRLPQRLRGVAHQLDIFMHAARYSQAWR